MPRRRTLTGRKERDRNRSLMCNDRKRRKQNQEELRPSRDDINFKISDGSAWQPKKNTRICSRHFVGNKKSEHPLSPSYVPTIFPDVYGRNKCPETGRQASERFNRTLKRQTAKTCAEDTAKLQNAVAGTSGDVSGSENDYTAAQRDRMTQVDFLEEPNDLKIFICNRFDYGIICHAEIQTAIPLIEGGVSEKKKVVTKKTPVYSLIESDSRYRENSPVKSHRKITDAASSFSSDIEYDKMDVREDPCRTVKTEDAKFVLPDIDSDYKETIASNPCERIKSEPIDDLIKCEATDISFEDTKIGFAENVVNSYEIKIEKVDSNNTDVNERFGSNSLVVNAVVKCEPLFKQEIDDATAST